MNKKKVCKQCRVVVDGDECPLCKGSLFTQSWNGRIVLLDSAHSLIGKRMGATASGEYAIKIK